jgi:hypothetical protein
MGYGLWFMASQYAAHGLISLLGLVGIMVGSLATSISFASTLKRFYCPKCVNFSCPLNAVPKPHIDAYLKRNEVMRKAWEASGWMID